MSTFDFAVSNNTMRSVREQLKSVLNARNLELLVDEAVSSGKSHVVEVPETSKIVAVFTTDEGISVGHGEAYYTVGDARSLEASRNMALAMLHANVRNDLLKMEQHTRNSRLNWHTLNVIRAVCAYVNAADAVFNNGVSSQFGREKTDDLINNFMFYFRNPAATEEALHEVLCATRRVKDVPYNCLDEDTKAHMRLQRAIAKGFIPETMEY